MINRQRICDEFSKQAAIDSPSFAEAEIAAYLEQRLTALGAEIEYDEAGCDHRQHCQQPDRPDSRQQKWRAADPVRPYGYRDSGGQCPTGAQRRYLHQLRGHHSRLRRQGRPDRND